MGESGQMFTRVDSRIAILYALLSLFLLMGGPRTYPHLHTILDTAACLQASLLAWTFWNIGLQVGVGFPRWIGAILGVTAILEGAHVLTTLEWSGFLEPLAGAVDHLRPATWSPPAYVLPIGIILGVLSTGRTWREPLRLGTMLFGVGAALTLFFESVPSYAPPAWLGITRPTLVPVPVLWAAAAWLCWRHRAEDRLLQPVIRMAGLFIVAHIAMLYSTSPHDAPSMVAHLGKVSGYLLLLLSTAQVAILDMADRLRTEQKLVDLNDALETRVRERTADLETGNRALTEEIATRRETEENLSQTNRALTILSGCNEALIRANDEDLLLQRVCEVCAGVGGYRIARVAYALDDETRSIVIKAEAGERQEFQTRIPQSWDKDRPEGQGAAGECIRTGEAILIEDVTTAPEFAHIATDLRAAQFGARLLLPLRGPERTFGLIALYSSEGVEIGPTELQLLKGLADDLAFGISALRTEEVRRRAEAAVAASLQEKKALLKEVHHRVKNNMQVITSLLRLEGRRIDHPATKVMVRDVQNRIQAMVTLHETLYKTGNFARVDVATYLGQLIAQIRRSLGTESRQVQFKVDLASTGLDLDQAVPCGLIVSELVSNALKHAFPDGRQGSIRIDLHEADRQLRLRVSDDGVGLPPEFESRREHSLGLKLVSDLARQLGGTLVIDPAPSFETTFPASPA